jgi:hypothetical protein
MLLAAIALVLIFVLGYELLHPGHEQPHTHSEAVELWHPPPPPDPGVPLTWQNNSQFVAAQVVIRHHRARLDAQTGAAMRSMPIGTNPALL